MKQAKLESIDLDSHESRKKIEKIFDSVCDCSWKYESTDSSKILHTILPDLLVMWDRKIRRGILGGEGRNWGGVYTDEFLPKMQAELKEAIETCMRKNALSRKDSIQYIRKACSSMALPKLLDEYNYMIYTRPEDLLTYIEDLRNKGEITSEEYERLASKI